MTDGRQSTPRFSTTLTDVTPTFRVRACWGSIDGLVALEARGATLDACHEQIARHILRLWPDLEEAAGWL